ncbi:MAG: rod shape-determining protein MreC [Proteobacteria bacterium]|nr:rod shape-determining protein MreC [Alphaproteobacteria bacterium]NCC02997.1 rod shape-determining protein MreC [Pseudomonadota bacterium]
MHTRRTGWVYTTALSWRAVAHRFSYALFLFLSIGLIFLGQYQPMVVNTARARVVDGVGPILDILSQPMAMIDTMSSRVQSYRSLMAENARLRVENALLVRWQNTALALESQNKELRELLKYKPEPSLAFISARVIGDTGTAFVRSLIVTAGRLQGVKQGMAAMTGEGLIGRVVEVGEWTSRILLITDMTSRIPVMVMGSGDHAILTGDNSLTPKLMYLPQDADVRPGMRVMTSGHGGVFPPNLPVGVIARMDHGEIQVVPMTSLGRINQIRLVDFGLVAGEFNPMTEKLQSDKTAP